SATKKIAGAGAMLAAAANPFGLTVATANFVVFLGLDHYVTLPIAQKQVNRLTYGYFDFSKFLGKFGGVRSAYVLDPLGQDNTALRDTQNFMIEFVENADKSKWALSDKDQCLPDEIKKIPDGPE